MTTPTRFQLAKWFDPELGRAELDGVVYLADDDRPVANAMTPHLGARYPVRSVTDEERAKDDSEGGHSLSELVRAYPVLPLLNATIDCSCDSELTRRIETLLAECCFGVAWDVDGDVSGAMRKYGIVHESLEAPLDATTWQPMAIEFYGEVTQLDGSPAGPGGTWIDGWRDRQGRDYRDVEIEVPFTIAVRAATCANVLYPGVDTASYL